MHYREATPHIASSTLRLQQNRVTHTSGGDSEDARGSPLPLHIVTVYNHTIASDTSKKVYVQSVTNSTYSSVNTPPLLSLHSHSHSSTE